MAIIYSKIDIIKLYINYIIKLKYYIRKESKEIGRKEYILLP